jgi:hypothetical protein
MVIICDLPGEGDFLSLQLWLDKGKSSSCISQKLSAFQSSATAFITNINHLEKSGSHFSVAIAETFPHSFMVFIFMSFPN